MPPSRTNAEWAALLPSETYRILFEEDTEFACSSGLLTEKRDGTFRKIKVELKGIPAGATVRAREGYTAPTK